MTTEPDATESRTTADQPQAAGEPPLAVAESTQTLPVEADVDVDDRPSAGRRWGRRFATILTFVGLVAVVVFGLRMANLIPELRSPFASETTDRSGPVLIKSIQNLSRYVAAEGTFQVIVDLQENKRFVPDVFFNERTLFVGVGSVDSYVDFKALTEGAIVASPDRTQVTVTLPAPVLERPSLDHDHSYVFAQEKGVINHVGDVFGGDPNKQQQLYQLAEEKIAKAAQDSELRSRAEKNTTAMLESLLHQLGYRQVTVKYSAP